MIDSELGVIKRLWSEKKSFPLLTIMGNYGLLSSYYSFIFCMFLYGKLLSLLFSLLMYVIFIWIDIFGTFKTIYI